MAALVTVLIGVLALHAALLALTAAGAAVLLTPGLLEETLGHAVGPLDYARLSWLIASLATVGGALGAGIEQTDRVREAASFRPTSGSRKARRRPSPRATS
jgi:cell division protein FtsX